MKLDFKEAIQFKKELDENKLIGVVLKPRLIEGSPRTAFTNKLPSHKICVPVYSDLSNEINGILPHHVIIDNPRLEKARVVAKLVESKTDAAQEVPFSVSRPQQSQSVMFDLVDLTKLYSIYSTPYIIKKQ